MFSDQRLFFSLPRICAAVLVSILIAGLWPFNPFPHNDVHWIPGRNGLHFGADNGIVTSKRLLEASAESPYFSLEIWLQPDTDYGTDTFLSFYIPLNPTALLVRQYSDLLEVRQGWAWNLPMTQRAGILTFSPEKETFFTLTMGPTGGALYIDGVLAQRAPLLQLSAQDLSGEIILGTSPINLSPWRGRVFGLAIYHRELTAAEAASHFEMWRTGKPSPSLEQDAVALYRFDERAGNIVYNRGTRGPDLRIPASFTVPHTKLWETPRNRLPFNQIHPFDIVVNVFGFIPFGFFYSAWFSRTRRRYPILTTILLGLIVSQVIESLQGYLPTRDPDFTDIVTNTFGAMSGAVLYRVFQSFCLVK